MSAIYFSRKKVTAIEWNLDTHLKVDGVPEVALPDGLAEGGRVELRALRLVPAVLLRRDPVLVDLERRGGGIGVPAPRTVLDTPHDSERRRERGRSNEISVFVVGWGLKRLASKQRLVDFTP